MAARRWVRVLLWWLGRVAFGLLLTAVFAGSLLLGAGLHLGTPTARRLTARLVTNALSDLFLGTVTVEGITHLGLRGLRVDDVRVSDEQGETVALLSDLRVHADAIDIADTLLFGGDKITIVVRHVRAERAEVFVVPDAATGLPTLVRAFTPTPSAPKAPSAPEKPARYVRAWLPEVELGRVYARGRLEGTPTLEVQLNGVRGSVLGTPKGAAVDVKRYGMVVRGLGGTDASGTGEVHIRAPGAVWSSFDGFFGNLSVGAFAYVKGDQVSLRLDLPRARPEDVRGLWVDYPLREAVSAHVEASGVLPVLQTSARFEVAGGRISASGPLRLAPSIGADLDVEGRDVNLRALWPELPATKVDVDTALSIWNKRGQIVLDVNGTTAPTKIAGHAVPAVDVTGTFNEKGFDGKATLHEEGLPLKVDFTVHPNGDVDVEAHARSFSLQKAPRVAALTPARGRADMRVKAHIENKRVSATMVADVNDFQLGDVKLGKGRLSGSARGPLASPEKLSVDADLKGSELAARGFGFGRVEATARGPVLRPKVSAKLRDEFGPNVTASATVDIDQRPTLKNLEVEVARGGAALSGKVKRLDLGGRELYLEQLSLKGAGGDLDGSVLVRPDRVVVKAKGEGLDLDRIARALGLPRGSLGGTLRVDADVEVTKDKSRGNVLLALGNGSLMDVGGVSLRLKADLQGTRFVGEASAVVESVGAIGGAWETELAGRAIEPKSWLEMTGLGEFQTANIDLSLLTYAFPSEARIEEVRGKAFGKFRVERADAKKRPKVHFIAGTEGLAVTRSGENEKDESLEITGIDLQVGGALDAESGDTSGTTRLVDRAGVLASASGSATFDMDAILAEPKTIGARLQSTPAAGVLVIPDRAIADLPKPIRPKGIAGVVGGRLNFSGTVREPTLAATLNAAGLKPEGSRLALPVDATVSAQYAPVDGRFAASGEATFARRRIAMLIAKGSAPIDSPRWTGGAQLSFDGTPIGVIPGLADGHMTGALHGTMAVQRPESGVPLMTANIELRDAAVDLVPVGTGNLFARTDGKTLTAKARLEKFGGHLAIDAGAGLTWEGAIPELDGSRPVRLTAEARALDAVVLAPFLRDVFSRLSGKLDANLATTLVAEKRNDETHWTGQIAGWATMKEGVMQFAPLGLQLEDVSFRAEARDAVRYTAIDVKNIVGRARSERQNVSATATLYLDGLNLVRANGALNVSEVPVLVQGVSQATATGSATMQLTRQEDHMRVEVSVPELEAKLPRASSRSVIEISDNPTIKVIQPLREPTEPSTGQALPWRIVVALGDRVRVTRNDMNVPITGSPVLELGNETTVKGFIDLEPGGRLQALGKNFVIETGRIAFDTDDPADPHLSATATWRAPDASIITIEVRGTLKDAQLKVSSDPPRPESEVMALLLGGSGASSDETSGSGARAAAGGVASAFNALFADSLFGVEIRTTTYEDKASYTAAVQVSDNVWFEGTYRASTVEGGQASTGADPVDLSGTIDWRFRRNWSLRTEIGTLGTGLDLLWQYRY